MSAEAATTWIPPALPQAAGLAGALGTPGSTSPEAMAALARALRGQRASLAGLKVERIVEVLDRAAALWFDPAYPPRHAVLGRISQATGFSLPMVERSIRHEMESSRAPELLAALRGELGDPGVLDGFRPSRTLNGRVRATGPGLVGGIVSSNIPALPHLTVMRSLLVKAPCLIKTSVSEPHFLPAYARTLMDLEPALGGAVGVVCYGRKETATTSALLANIDFLIAYGGLEAIGQLRAAAPPGLPALYHGHRLGFALLASEALPGPGLARQVAYDVVLFDQEACLAPHVVFVEGDQQAASRFGQALAAEMATLADELPPGEVALARAWSVRQALDGWAVEAPGPLELLPVLGGTAGHVVVGPLERFEPSPLSRTVRVVPVADLDQALALVKPLGGLLQNVALAAPPARREALVEQLAALGVTRVCPPGRMGIPSMMWHHDGHPCLAAMLRFTDEEGFKEQPPGDRPAS